MQKRKFVKATAFLTVLVFTLTNNGIVPQAHAQIPRMIPMATVPLNVSALNIPADFGEVIQFAKGKSGQSPIVLIQDAHSIPDAQRHIGRLIDHMVTTYGITEVAVEGAASSLDAQIFRSFPDKDLLKKVMKEYGERGELAGAPSAAIFGSGTANIQGVENWDLYQEGIALYLEALQKQPAFLEKLNAECSALDAEKEKFYSKDLLAVDTAVEKFYLSDANLIDLIRILGKYQVPQSGSQLEAVWKEASKAQRPEAGSPTKDIEVREISKRIEAFLLHLTTPAAGLRSPALELKEFNSKKQAWQTGQITAEAFSLDLKEMAAKLGIPIQMSADLLGEVQVQRTLKQIEGTKLFTELEDWISEVKQKLMGAGASSEVAKDLQKIDAGSVTFEMGKIQSAAPVKTEIRSLDQQTVQMRLLTKLAKLELSRSEWNLLRQTIDRRQQTTDGTSLLSSVFGLQSPQVAFYQNAEAREEAMFQNLLKTVQSQTTKHESRENRPAIFVAGGFHTEGMIEKLKKAGLGYAVVMPKIRQMPDQNFYVDHMRGNVSWKSYFKIENGGLNLYNAFVRATRDRLVTSNEYSVPGSNSAIRGTNYALLKSWRDQLIRDLADQERLADAGKYLHFLDEIQNKMRDDFIARGMQKVDAFLAGLEKLNNSKQLNEANVLKLLQTPAANAWTATPVLAADGGSEFRLPGLLKLLTVAIVGLSIRSAAPAAERARSVGGKSNADDARAAMTRSESRTEGKFLRELLTHIAIFFAALAIAYWPSSAMALAPNMDNTTPLFIAYLAIGTVVLSFVGEWLYRQWLLSPASTPTPQRNRRTFWGWLKNSGWFKASFGTTQKIPAPAAPKALSPAELAAKEINEMIKALPASAAGHQIPLQLLSNLSYAPFADTDLTPLAATNSDSKINVAIEDAARIIGEINYHLRRDVAAPTSLPQGMQEVEQKVMSLRNRLVEIRNEASVQHVRDLINTLPKLTGEANTILLRTIINSARIPEVAERENFNIEAWLNGLIQAVALSNKLASNPATVLALKAVNSGALSAFSTQSTTLLSRLQAMQKIITPVRSEFRVSLDRQGFLQMTPLSDDFFQKMRRAENPEAAFAVMKNEISRIATDLRSMIQANGQIPNKIGNGEKSIFNVAGLAVLTSIPLSNATLASLLQQDEVELQGLAQEASAGGLPRTKEAIRQEMTDRMIEILATSFWMYLKRYDDWVQFGANVATQKNYVTIHERGSLLDAVQVFDTGNFLYPDGKYLISGSRAGTGFGRGKVDITVQFENNGPSYLRLNLLSIALASIGYLQKGPPSTNSPDQAYPTSYATFWRLHVAPGQPMSLENTASGMAVVDDIQAKEAAARHTISEMAETVTQRREASGIPADIGRLQGLSWPDLNGEQIYGSLLDQLVSFPRRVYGMLKSKPFENKAMVKTVVTKAMIFLSRGLPPLEGNKRLYLSFFKPIKVFDIEDSLQILFLAATVLTFVSTAFLGSIAGWALTATAAVLVTVVYFIVASLIFSFFYSTSKKSLASDAGNYWFFSRDIYLRQNGSLKDTAAHEAVHELLKRLGSLFWVDAATTFELYFNNESLLTTHPALKSDIENGEKWVADAFKNDAAGGVSITDTKFKISLYERMAHNPNPKSESYSLGAYLYGIEKGLASKYGVETAEWFLILIASEKTSFSNFADHFIHGMLYPGQRSSARSARSEMRELTAKQPATKSGPAGSQSEIKSVVKPTLLKRIVGMTARLAAVFTRFAGGKIKDEEFRSLSREMVEIWKQTAADGLTFANFRDLMHNLLLAKIAADAMRRFAPSQVENLGISNDVVDRALANAIIAAGQASRDIAEPVYIDAGDLLKWNDTDTDAVSEPVRNEMIRGFVAITAVRKTRVTIVGDQTVGMQLVDAINKAGLSRATFSHELVTNPNDGKKVGFVSNRQEGVDAYVRISAVGDPKFLNPENAAGQRPVAALRLLDAINVGTKNIDATAAVDESVVRDLIFALRDSHNHIELEHGRIVFKIDQFFEQLIADQRARFEFRKAA